MSTVTETELKAKAVAPRVTMEALDDNIGAISFINAGEAANSMGQPATDSMNLLTLCILTLRNGFTVVGQSACASPANYDQDIGNRLAFNDAKGKVWALMGYALRDKLQAEQDLLEGRAFTHAGRQGVYIGTKVVHAYPMNRRDYNMLRGWQLPADENGDDEGYVVEYTDRVENPIHVAGFAGYVSWSPKDVFENAYHQVKA